MSWHTVPLSSAFEFIRNGMSVKQVPDAGGLPITRIETISDGTVNPGKVGFAGLEHPMAIRWLLRPGDILFSHINSFEHVGKCAVYRGEPEELVHGMNLLCLRPDQGRITTEYAKHLLRSRGFRTQLERFINKAVNQASVSIGNLSSIPIPLPPLDEQRRIAAMMDRGEELRAKRRAAIALLDQLPQAIFLEMFGDPVINSKGWNLVHLGDLAWRKPNNGIFRKNPEYLEFGGDGLPVVWVEELFRQHPIDVTLSRRIMPTEGEVEKYGLEFGDLLFCRSSLKLDGIAFNNVYLGPSKSALFECHIIRISPDLSRVSPVFLNEMLRLPSMRERVKGRAKTATMTTIDQAGLAATVVALPPIELQAEFADRVRTIQLAKATRKNALNEVNALFASLQATSFARGTS